MDLGTLAYGGIAIGVYLVVAQDRGRIVGAMSAAVWPIIIGMWAAHRAIKDEDEMDWSGRVTWTPKDRNK